MRLFQRSAKFRFAIAVGASIGAGQTLFQAFTRNLGPAVRLVAAVTTTAAISLVISLALEGLRAEPAEQRQA